MYSKLDTSLEPYQKTRATMNMTMDWESANSKLLQMAVLFDLRKGSSRLELYKLQQSSSRVKAATVRIEPAASQANWAEDSCSFLLAWSLSTTTR